MLEVAWNLPPTDDCQSLAADAIVLLATRCKNELAQALRFYLGGIGDGVWQDYKQALELLSKYVPPPHNSRFAQRWWGESYCWGNGCGKDELKALQMWTAAAEQGDGEAMYWVGWMHWDGRAGLQRDEEQALLWWRRAVHYSKHARSAWRIGDCYANGVGGVLQSAVLENAWKWCAAVWHHWDAKDEVRRGKVKQPSPADVAEAWKVTFIK